MAQNTGQSVGLGERLAALSPTEKAIRTAAFDVLLAARPATASGIAEMAGMSEGEVLDQLPGMVRMGLLAVDEEGRVVGCHGLSLVETLHRLEMLGHQFYTWCALDAVGIPAALQQDAVAVSPCGRCGHPLEIRFRAGKVVQASVPSPLIRLVSSELGKPVAGHT